MQELIFFASSIFGRILCVFVCVTDFFFSLKNVSLGLFCNMKR